MKIEASRNLTSLLNNSFKISMLRAIDHRSRKVKVATGSCRTEHVGYLPRFARTASPTTKYVTVDVATTSKHKSEIPIPNIPILQCTGALYSTNACHAYFSDVEVFSDFNAPSISFPYIYARILGAASSISSSETSADSPGSPSSLAIAGGPPSV